LGFQLFAQPAFGRLVCGVRGNDSDGAPEKLVFARHGNPVSVVSLAQCIHLHGNFDAPSGLNADRVQAAKRAFPEVSGEVRTQGVKHAVHALLVLAVDLIRLGGFELGETLNEGLHELPYVLVHRAQGLDKRLIVHVRAEVWQELGRLVGLLLALRLRRWLRLSLQLLHVSDQSVVERREGLVEHTGLVKRLRVVVGQSVCLRSLQVIGADPGISRRSGLAWDFLG
jgi:hypothetical protein